jgi:hypothetical protein
MSGIGIWYYSSSVAMGKRPRDRQPPMWVSMTAFVTVLAALSIFTLDVIGGRPRHSLRLIGGHSVISFLVVREHATAPRADS